jgi:hypothetical protein
MPLIPDNETARRQHALDGQITTEPGLTGGPFIQMMAWIEVPPEWLERAIPLVDDPEEDAPCR